MNDTQMRSRPKRVAGKTFLPKVEGPITGEIEDQLEQLVARFGEEKLLKVLDLFIRKCKWDDWQCVRNAIWRIARKNERLSYGKRFIVHG